MSASTALLSLRAREIARTWRLWVLPTVIVFLAATGPVIVRFTREILAAALGAEEAAAIPWPDPTATDASAQWASDLTQLVVFIIVVMAAGAINAEVRSGVAAILLVKPVSRTTYVLTHALALVCFIALAGLLGAFVSWCATSLTFGIVDPAPILGATAVWVVLAAVLVAASLLASAAIDAVAGAAGVGIGVYFLLALLSIVPQLSDYTPAGLIRVTTEVATGTQQLDATLWWPIATGLLLAVALLAAAVLVFRRREI